MTDTEYTALIFTNPQQPSERQQRLQIFCHNTKIILGLTYITIQLSTAILNYINNNIHYNPLIITIPEWLLITGILNLTKLILLMLILYTAHNNTLYKHSNTFINVIKFVWLISGLIINMSSSEIMAYNFIGYIFIISWMIEYLYFLIKIFHLCTYLINKHIEYRQLRN